MVELLSQYVPLGLYVGALLRYLVAMACLSYGHSQLRLKNTLVGWMNIIFSGWLFFGGISQGYEPMTGKLTWWGAIMYLLLLITFVSLSLESYGKEEYSDA